MRNANAELQISLDNRKYFLSAPHLECHNYCPALGMYARMWSPLSPLSHCQCEKPGATQKHESASLARTLASLFHLLASRLRSNLTRTSSSLGEQLVSND